MKQRGFTLVEALVTAAILGGLALALSQLTKQQGEQTVASAISNETAILKTQIQSYLNAPSHCNANFYGVTSTLQTNPYQPAAGINTCGLSTDSCRGSSAVQLGTIKKYTDDPSVGTNWASVNSTSKRVRVSGVDIWVDPLNVPAPTTVNGKTIYYQYVTTGYMKVWIQSKLYNSINGNATMDPTFGNQKNVKVDSVVFKTPVIWNGSKVVGCPKSWNSTLPYCPSALDNNCCTYGATNGVCN